MALISFYVVRFIASIQAKSGPLPEAAQPALLFSGAGRRAELKSYTASRVRRSTAATGE